MGPPTIEDAAAQGLMAGINVLQQKRKAPPFILGREEAYIDREKENAKRREKTRELKIPTDFDYATITGLKTESLEKLSQLRPPNLDSAHSVGEGYIVWNFVLPFIRQKRREHRISVQKSKHGGMEDTELF